MNGVINIVLVPAALLFLSAHYVVGQETRLGYNSEVPTTFEVTLNLRNVELRHYYEKETPTVETLKYKETIIFCNFDIVNRNTSNENLFVFGGYNINLLDENGLPQYSIMYGITDSDENKYLPGEFKVDTWFISKDVPKETNINEALLYCTPSPKGQIGVEFFNWGESYNGFFAVGSTKRKDPANEISFKLLVKENIDKIEKNCESPSC